MRKIFAFILVTILLVSMSTIVNSNVIKIEKTTDIDPFVDVTVTFEVEAIRLLEDYDSKQGTIKSLSQLFLKRIFDKKYHTVSNDDNKPSSYLKVFINDVEFTSDIWSKTRFIYDPQWSATLNVPDDQELVNMKIQLWESKNGGDLLYDISGDSKGDQDQYDVELVYNIKTGHWTGDDEIADPSGYGRVCGCDDGTIHKKDRDCEMWFNIYQNDYDDDGLPYWLEVNEYGSNPAEKNSGDPDEDGIPVEWEWKWEYNPFLTEDHEKFDPDGDSIDNVEEYLTSEWFSDPFRKDVFVEFDLMDEGPNGEKSYFPEMARERIKTAFNRQNIVYHMDMGEMGGYELIPFDDMAVGVEFQKIYTDYFLHGDEDNWRRGIFHYGVIVYKSEGPAGYMFRHNAFQVTSSGHEIVSENTGLDRDIVYACAYMHELGHTFAFWPIPGHNRLDGLAGLIDYFRSLPYRSCMNYHYMYWLVDYSDGSRGAGDYDDWERMKLDYFES